MDNRLNSLRKSPAQLLRGRLPRQIELGHDQAAGLSQSSRSNDGDQHWATDGSLPEGDSRVQLCCGSTDLVTL